MDLNAVQVIIHVGMPKTASTTLQKHLSFSSGEAFLYPDIGRYDSRLAHHEFFYALCGQSEAIRTPLPPPRHDFDAFVNVLKDEILASEKQIVILSSEQVWNPVAFDEPTLHRLQHALEPMHVIILAYLRDPATHAVSGYAQRVKGPQSYCGTFSQSLQELYSEGIYEYQERIKALQRTFGPDQVIVERYEEFGADPTRPLRETMGVPMEPIIRNSSNVGLPWLFIALLRQRNRLKANGYSKSASAVSRIARVGIRTAFLRNCAKRFDKLFYPMDHASKELVDHLSSCYSNFRKPRERRAA